MTGYNDDDSLGRLIKSAYRPVTASPELKKRLLERLMVEVNMVTAGTPISLRDRPQIWIPIAVAIIAGVIGYGVWLSANISSSLLP